MAENTRGSAGAPKDTRARAILVVSLVALACATVVSATAMLLAPAREGNRAAEKDALLRGLLASVPGVSELVGGAEGRLQARVVDLGSGQSAPADDESALAPAMQVADVAIPESVDVAGLKMRPQRAVVYVVERDGRPALIILPVSGRGYASLLSGYLALEGDAKTVVALTIADQAETPGIGTKILDPAWSGLWKGKTAFAPDGTVRLHVASGKVDPASPDARHAVDGITGATRTTQGVTNMLRYWLGDHGFGPYLARMRAESARP